MKVIIPTTPLMEQIVGPQKRAEGQRYRLMTYVVQQPVADGVLLYNTLTCSLVLLTPDEAADITAQQELIDRWFLVPEDHDDRKLCRQVRQMVTLLKPAAKDFRIFWDNAYCIHHLFHEDVRLLDILDECKKAGNPNMVYMYFSTSKITFPGAGLAGMASSEENITAIKKRMSVQSIGPDKINQLRHMKFFNNLDGLLEQMKKHAEIIRPKFEAVEETLTAEFGDSDVAVWSKPNGGYFVSLNVMDGCAKRTVQLCKEAGVTLTKAGATYPYGDDPHDSNIRIAPTSPTVEELTEAMKILAVSAKLAAVEKLLKA